MWILPIVTIVVGSAAQPNTLEPTPCPMPAAVVYRTDTHEIR
jgi:hypothetical protein